ncbi:MAG TPA: hypothetical protein PL155_02345 [Candidatus Omnitrophota bacterium]|nr:hypothetical protein [Candidatus Omnitrophota bacterium]HPD84675.1 hypothetical protein [Candidatus Omnitrophota bacterium]HRZ03533.1 hypothetical protein [Candidatus Omnitrophota bacterium]
MVKNILLLLTLSTFVFVGVAAADDSRIINSIRGQGKATGVIKDIKRNTITIYDEEERELRSFIYVSSDIKEFQAGERVRIYYTLPGNIAEVVKKMTPLEYKKEGQNLGYFSGGPRDL